jgi:hypothetical protein
MKIRFTYPTVGPIGGAIFIIGGFESTAFRSTRKL